LCVYQSALGFEYCGVGFPEFSHLSFYNKMYFDDVYGISILVGNVG